MPFFQFFWDFISRIRDIYNLLQEIAEVSDDSITFSPVDENNFDYGVIVSPGKLKTQYFYFI